MKKCGTLIVLGYFATALIGHAQSAAPIVECKIKNCLKSNQGGNASTTCTVANGEYINLHIHVKGVGSTPVEKVPPNMINPATPPPQGVYYLIKVVRESDGVEVPTRNFDTGSGGNKDGFTEKVSLEISETPAVRRAKIQAYWNKVKANANAADQATLSKTSLKDGDILNSLDKNLVENQLGQFKITCSYVSTKQGTWNGQADSAPITVDVVNKGTIMDKNSP
jgi:hypothetical protein